MNGAALIAAIRTSTLVPSTQVTDDQVLSWINEGYYRIVSQRSWPWLEQSGELATVAAQQAYPLATSIVDDVEAVTPVARSVRRIVAVYDDTKRVRLRQWSPSTAVSVFGDQWTSSQHAYAFYIWGGSLHLIPVPSDSDILYRVLLHKAPTALTVGGAPEFDPIFHHCLAHYGEFRMWQREEDLDKATAAYAHYSDMVERMASWYAQTVDDSPWQIGVGGSAGAWTNTPFLDGL